MMSDAAASSSSFDSRPVPDPTILTTAQLDREIAHIKELFSQQFDLIERQRLESKADAEKALAAALAAAQGRQSGSSTMVGFVIGFAGVAVAVASLVALIVQ